MLSGNRNALVKTRAIHGADEPRHLDLPGEAAEMGKLVLPALRAGRRE
jgi:hypothetical protein